MEESKINAKIFNSKFERTDLIGLHREISAEYLGITPKTDHIKTPILDLQNVLDKVKQDGKLPTADFKYVYPDIEVKDMTKTWGFTSDPKIADLVITLNRLGLSTSSACEGHPNQQESFSLVSFWNEEFYKVLAHLADWEEVRSSKVKIRSVQTGWDTIKGRMFDIIFDTGNLSETQKLAQRFSDYLKSKAR